MKTFDDLKYRLFIFLRFMKKKGEPLITLYKFNIDEKADWLQYIQKIVGGIVHLNLKGVKSTFYIYPNFC